ncbi:MAG TPA: glutathione S-transferase family protein [Nannocystaceae bacterium]|nr:glutathione S-transferase family protein [Nannocystaceae bacterium]
MHTLITIPFSHYNEKARWALQRFGVPFRERAYMPVLHFAPVMIATRFGRDGKADRASTRFSTPLLVTDEGERICDSTDIVRWVCDRYADADTTLVPDDEVLQVERELGEKLGPHARRVAYGLNFSDRKVGATLARRLVGPTQAFVWRVMQPVFLKGIFRALQVDPARVDRSIDVVRSLFAEFGDRIAGRRYLVGDRFTVADLAFAALAAPAIMPTRAEGYAGDLPELDQLPPRAAALARELRATTAGRYALRIFAEERRVVLQPRAAA